MRIEGAGRVFRKYRDKHGLTLGELAKRLKWDKSRLSLYENDKRSISLAVIFKVAKALDERPEVLMFDCLKS